MKYSKAKLCVGAIRRLGYQLIIIRQFSDDVVIIGFSTGHAEWLNDEKAVNVIEIASRIHVKNLFKQRRAS